MASCLTEAGGCPGCFVPDPCFELFGSKGRELRWSGMDEKRGSASDTQFGDGIGVPLLALAAHVVEQTLATTDHLQQPLAGREVVDVVLQVAAEAIDPLAQHRNLNLSRPGVCSVGLMGVDQLLLLGGIQRHARGAALSRQTTSLPRQGPVADITWMQARNQASAFSSSDRICSDSICSSACRISDGS